MNLHEKLSEIDFYLVTDSGLSKEGTISDVKQAVNAGCKIVQYREKEKNTREMIKDASRIKEICKGRAIFLVNDRIDVALAVDADGVHIGQGDMPFEITRRLLGEDKIIGITVHDVHEAKEAASLGADYIGLSPIFSTSTKKDAGKSCGTTMIEKVKKEVSVPIIAIGGINKENMDEVILAGADSVVAISAVVCSEDVKKEVEKLIRIIHNNKQKEENKNDNTT